MLNMFRQNKGLIDHCVGGFVWAVFGCIQFWQGQFDEFSLGLWFVFGVLLGAGYEVYQLYFQPNSHARPLLDAVEDFVGEVFFGIAGLFYMVFLCKIASEYCVEIGVISVVLGFVWLFYSYFVRWR